MMRLAQRMEANGSRARWIVAVENWTGADGARGAID